MEDLQRFLNYKELFSKCYLENNSIESEEISKNELEILEDLDPDEVYENLKDLLQSLLYHKRQTKYPEAKPLETINSHTENSKSEDEEDQLKVLTEENKELKRINEELKVKNDGLGKSLVLANAKVQDHEKRLKEKVSGSKKVVRDKGKTTTRPLTGDKPEKSKVPDTPHKRVASLANTEQKDKLKSIKSVKFEYFLSTPLINKTSGSGNSGKFLVNSPNRGKKPHARSSSSMIDTFKKHK